MNIIEELEEIRIELIALEAFFPSEKALQKLARRIQKIEERLKGELI
jgi:hypothetical protein